jgi:hypothetical protein
MWMILKDRNKRKLLPSADRPHPRILKIPKDRWNLEETSEDSTQLLQLLHFSSEDLE